MSFARMGIGGSDVYVFESFGGFIECNTCFLVPYDPETLGNVRLKTPRLAIEHLEKHKAAGHNIGEAIEEIQKEYENLDEQFQKFEHVDQRSKDYREWVKEQWKKQQENN